MNFTVIIPSTCSDKNIPLLKSCLESIDKSCKSIKGINIRKIVVSNYKSNSTNTKGLPIDQTIIVNSKTGFGEMNNIGIDRSFKLYDSDYILFVNDDAKLDKEFFKELLRIINVRDPDIVIPLIYDYVGNDIDSFGLRYLSSGYSLTNRNISGPSNLASGCCFVTKISFLKKVKKNYGFYFNPIFFYYYEDTEFSIRAICSGAKIVKSEKVIAYHLGSQSTGDKSTFKYYYSYRNLLWAILITWPYPIILRKLFKILLFQFLVFILLTYYFGVKSYIKIIVDTIKNIKILMLLRSKIQKIYIKDINFNNVMEKYIFCTSRSNCI